MNTTLDLWCARNLGILAILGLLGICMVCGPLLLFLIVSGPFYALTSIRYMPWLQAASWITAFTICQRGQELIIDIISVLVTLFANSFGLFRGV